MNQQFSFNNCKFVIFAYEEGDKKTILASNNLSYVELSAEYKYNNVSTASSYNPIVIRSNQIYELKCRLGTYKLIQGSDYFTMLQDLIKSWEIKPNIISKESINTPFGVVSVRQVK